jgi:DNA adenine methylase
LKIRSIIKWFGGKYYMIKNILPFPIHRGYIEVFGGSAVILLNKIPSNIEIYNDINSRLINFWRILKEYKEELKELSEKEGGIDSRVIFEECKEISDNSIEDAMRFFYVNHHSFSGMNDGYKGLYDINTELSTRRKSFNIPHAAYLNQIKRIDEIYERIKYVIFECKDFRKLLKRFDKPNYLWYIDPPYFKGGEFYEKGIGGIKWGENNIYDLRNILDNVENTKFVLSIDKKEYFENKEWFYQKIERVNFASSLKVKSKSYEWIIRNFDPKKCKKMKKKNTKQIDEWIGGS